MGVFASDTFTAANCSNCINGRTADVGGSWATVNWGSSTGGINTNRAFGGNSLSGFEIDPSPAPAGGNYSVFADLVYRGVGGINPVGVFGRSNASGDGFALYRGNTTIYLYRIDAGSSTLLDSVSISYANCNIELSLFGSTIEGYVIEAASGNYVTSAGGTSSTRQACVSATDSNHASNTRVGMYLNNSLLSTRVHIDNFSAAEAETYTESVTSTMSLSGAASVVVARRPAYFKASGNRVRLARLGDNDIVGGIPTSEFLIEALSDTDSATYYYYGGIDGDGNWKINRYLKTDLNSISTANEDNNGSYATLSAAWTDRTTLTYG